MSALIITLLFLTCIIELVAILLWRWSANRWIDTATNWREQYLRATEEARGHFRKQLEAEAEVKRLTKKLTVLSVDNQRILREPIPPRTCMSRQGTFKCHLDWGHDGEHEAPLSEGVLRWRKGDL